MSSYAYTFHYADSGRRAMNGMYRVPWIIATCVNGKKL